MPRKDTFVDLCKMLEKADAKICFCTLCSHDESFGYCYTCPCHNHVDSPLSAKETLKVQAAVDHLKEICRRISQENKELRNE